VHSKNESVEFNGHSRSTRLARTILILKKFATGSIDLEDSSMVGGDPLRKIIGIMRLPSPRILDFGTVATLDRSGRAVGSSV
jgi:hypothetical protein